MKAAEYHLSVECPAPARAAALAKELTAFFKRHAKECDPLRKYRDVDPSAITNAARALGKKYGLDWQHPLTWHDIGFHNSEPAVTALGATLVVYHAAIAGFGSDLPRVLAAAGARVGSVSVGVPVIYGDVVVPAGEQGKALVEQLRVFFDHRNIGADVRLWASPPKLALVHRGKPAEYSFSCDGQRIAFTWPLRPDRIEVIEEWLRANGARDIAFRLATAADIAANNQRESTALPKPKRAKKAALKLGAPWLEKLTEPDEESYTHLFAVACGGAVAGEELFIVGGQGYNFIMRSLDGRDFVDVESNGAGLRAVVADGQQLWMSGEQGFLGRTSNGGRTFKKLNTATKACLHALARAPDGTLWVGGDDGFLAGTNGKTLTRVRGIKSPISHLAATSLGMLASTDDGLYRIERGRVTATSLRATVFQSFVTSRGTLLVPGARNAIYRSTDGGNTFQRSKVPAFKPARIPPRRRKQLERGPWQEPGYGLLCVAELDGRLVVAGDQGVVLTSTDDGATFQVIKHRLTHSHIHVAIVFRNAIYLGGDHHTVMVVR
jgi:hypothetical protein